MNGDIFIDGIENIVLSQGMVRMDLASFSVKAKNKEGKPAVETKQRIVMTPQGFLRTHGAMERMLNELIKSGVVREKTEEQRSGPARDQAASIEVKDRRGNGQDGKPAKAKEGRRRRILRVR